MNVAPGPNQTPPFVDIDLFKTDIALGEAMVRAGCRVRSTTEMVSASPVPRPILATTANEPSEAIASP